MKAVKSLNPGEKLMMSEGPIHVLICQRNPTSHLKGLYRFISSGALWCGALQRSGLNMSQKWWTLDPLVNGMALWR